MSKEIKNHITYYSSLITCIRKELDHGLTPAY